METVIINEKRGGSFEIIEDGQLLENGFLTLIEAEKWAKENEYEVTIIFTNR